jgi:uncharacterized protein
MKIDDALLEMNKWWNHEFDIVYKERDVHKQLAKYVELRQMIALTGLRRTGKTTLMLKLAYDRMKAGFDRKNVVYFSFDEFRERDVREVLQQYAQLMDRDLNSGKYLLLLDEIQKIDDWENKVKTVYDNFKNIKIIVSGSESLFVRKKSKESLAGRIFEFKVKPLNFREFLRFKDFKDPNPLLHKQELLRLFREYMSIGAFPELVNVKDNEIINRYLKETVMEKIIYKDIPAIFPIKDPSVLERIFRSILDTPGQLIEINKFSQELGISRRVLSLYMHYLEASYLILKLYNFSRNRKKMERKLKKYYAAVPALALIGKKDALSFSKAFENVIALELDAEFFWRDPYKNEVDIVLTGSKIVPIEVKYGSDTDVTGLQRFMKKFGVDKGYIVSFDIKKSLKKDNRSIEVIPAYDFLLNR